MNEVLYVTFMEDGQDFQRNQLTVLKLVNGQYVFHRKLDKSKLIDGDDLIIKVETDE